jgi:hypothetical protein
MLTTIVLSVNLLATEKAGQAAAGGGAGWPATHGVARHPTAACKIVMRFIEISLISQ